MYARKARAASLLVQALVRRKIGEGVCIDFAEFARSGRGEGRRVDEGGGEDANFDVTRLNELSSLGNVFAEDEFGFYFFVEAGVFEGFAAARPYGAWSGLATAIFWTEGSRRDCSRTSQD